VPKRVGERGDNTLFYCIGAFCWCAKDIINVDCLDVEVLEEKRNLFEHSLKIDKRGLPLILLHFKPEAQKVEQSRKMITVECVTDQKT
jgi:hypothetical protein